MVQRLIRHFPCISSSRVTSSPLASVGQLYREYYILNAIEKRKKNTGSKYYSCQSFQRNQKGWGECGVLGCASCLVLQLLPPSAIRQQDWGCTTVEKLESISEKTHLGSFHLVQNPAFPQSLKLSMPPPRRGLPPSQHSERIKDTAEERAVLTEAAQSIWLA